MKTQNDFSYNLGFKISSDIPKPYNISDGVGANCEEDSLPSHS